MNKVMFNNSLDVNCPIGFKESIKEAEYFLAYRFYG